MYFPHGNVETMTTGTTTASASNIGEEIVALIPTKSTKLGINIKTNTEGLIYVGKMEPDSPFQMTDLKVGMFITLINETSVDGMAISEVATLLNEGNNDSTNSHLAVFATSNPTTGVSISRTAIANIVSGSTSPMTDNNARTTSAAPDDGDVIAIIPTGSTQLGILVESDSRGLIFVSKMESNSPFQTTDLKVGMIMTLVNGMPVDGMTIPEVVQVLEHGNDDRSKSFLAVRARFSSSVATTTNTVIFPPEQQPQPETEGTGAPSSSTPKLTKALKRTTIILMSLDFITTTISLRAASQGVDCCDQENVQGTFGIVQLVTAWTYAALLFIELVLLIRNEMIFLTIANPLMGYLLMIWLLYTASKVEAIITCFTASVSFALDIWTTWKIFKTRKWVLVAVQGVTLLFGSIAMYIFFQALQNGGVCIAEPSDNGDWFIGDPIDCKVCPGSGIPANNTDMPCLDQDPPNGDYCGTEYPQFCFIPF